MESKLYLKRIGVSKVKPPSLEFLTELQNRHLLSIPFEDLDIPTLDRIILNLERIYKKIIPTKRGGFCYELNGLFYWLLTQIGFNVEMLSARVYNHQKQELGPEFDHMVLLVHLDKDHLVDVGFGDSFRKPIKMPNGECIDVSGHYRLYKLDGCNFELRREEENQWMLQYSFTTIPRRLSDFVEMCKFQQDSPSSSFRTRMKCTIATSTGRITLSNNSLTVTENGKKNKIEFEKEEDFYKLLKKYFLIDL